jgi:hypothetical protein
MPEKPNRCVLRPERLFWVDQFLQQEADGSFAEHIFASRMT